MKRLPGLVAAAAGVGAAFAPAVAPAAVSPNLKCQHFLATVGSAGDLPYPIVQQIKPWMAFHGEPWKRTDAYARAL